MMDTGMNKTLLSIGALALVVALSACGGEKKSLSQRAGSVISGSAADFVAGVGEGVDRRMNIDLDVDPEMQAKGLSVTFGKSRGVGSKDASVYVTAANPFEGKLLAKALDVDGVEIGRSVIEVSFEADDAQYVNFTFNDEMDSQMVRKYALSVR